MSKSPIRRFFARCRTRWRLKRIKQKPARTPFTTRLLGPALHALDSRSFYYTYKEIFLRESYCFETDSDAPLIIDGGANIGLSVIYFKKTWPNAHVLAFEPDADVFRVLQHNVESFGLQNVTLVNAALWNEETTLPFFAQGADAGRLFPPQSEFTTTQVRSERLRQYVRGPVEMLKLDIEGAEVEVVLDCVDCLRNIENMLIEYHSFSSEPQRLDELLRVLRDAGFRVQIQTQFAAQKPLVEQKLQLGMDLQLNVFAYRNRSNESGSGSRHQPTGTDAAA